MFVDASAIVAILRGEPRGAGLLEAIKAAPTRLTSPIAIWEAAVAMRRETSLTVDDARESVEDFLIYMRIETASLGSVDAVMALDAFARYGKKYHPARLNMGDCFAYACAKVHKVPLLYIGNDFALTDVNEGFKDS